MKRQFINQRMTETVNKVRMKMLNISEETQVSCNRKWKCILVRLDNAKENKGYMEAAAIVGTVMGFAIYISLFFYGTMIMKGVMERRPTGL